MNCRIRADGVMPGDILLATWNDWGRCPVRMGTVLRVDHFVAPNGEPIAHIWTAPYGGPAYCADTTVEVDRP